MNFVKRQNAYGAYYVDIGIQNISKNLIYHYVAVFDTGAACTVFDRRTLQRLGYTIDDSKIEKLRTASGYSHMSTTTITNFRLGDYTTTKLQIGVTDMSHLDTIGVIGMDFIDQFVWVINTSQNGLFFLTQDELNET